MIEDRFPSRRDEESSKEVEPAPLEELRKILVGSERTRLEEVVERLDDRELQIEDVARALPRAIRLRNRDNKDLALSLAPTIEETLDQAIRNDPQKIAKSLSPVMMPAIRQSIINTVRGMTESLNRTLEHTLSIKGLKWRLEAKRTGRSFGEVVLLRTLLYRVDQVFLIHRDTGLLMQHVSGQEVVEDADLVSGMLTAIQDFVSDSFGAEGGSLESLEVGDFTVWIERGPHAMLAAVIRGHPPAEVRTTLQSALEQIHAQFESELHDFDGNSEALELCRPYLEECCVESAREAEEPERKVSVVGIVGVLLLVLLVWWVSGLFREHEEVWAGYVQALRDEPGIEIVEIEPRGDAVRIIGLRDPLARDPELVLSEFDLDPDVVQALWVPQTSAEEQFVLWRAYWVLDPPETGFFELHGDVLVVGGVVGDDWIRRAELLVRTLPHVRRLEWNLDESPVGN